MAPAYSKLVQENAAMLQSHFSWLTTPFTMAQSRARLQYLQQQWQASQAFHFGIVNAGGRLTGEIAIDALHAQQPSGNISYWVSKQAQGRGMATRALLLLACWAKNNLPLQYLDIKMTVDNIASRCVAQKAGALFSHLIPAHPLATGLQANVYLFRLYL